MNSFPTWSRHLTLSHGCVYSVYFVYSRLPSVISLTAPVIAILLRHAQHPCIIIPVNHHFCPQNPPKCIFFAFSCQKICKTLNVRRTFAPSFEIDRFSSKIPPGHP